MASFNGKASTMVDVTGSGNSITGKDSFVGELKAGDILYFTSINLLPSRDSKFVNNSSGSIGIISKNSEFLDAYTGDYIAFAFGNEFQGKDSYSLDLLVSRLNYGGGTVVPPVTSTYTFSYSYMS